MWYKNVAGRFFGLTKKHACDRRTDRQNYDSQERASMGASRGKILVGYKSGMSTVRESCKSTELKRCIATELRWSKYAVSLISPD